MLKKVSSAEIAAARARGRATMMQPWWPTDATYSRKQDAIIVTMRSGFQIVIPRLQLLDLQDATPDEVAELELMGDGLHWEKLDVDIALQGVLAKALGPKLLSSETGRRGGRAKTKEKAAAARANGAKGGRPRKTVTK